MTDEQLIADARTGSREAFEVLFDRYRRPIWEFFRRRTTDAARAEELAQDTFVALLEGASRYEARAAFRTYLFGIAYNVLYADRRKAALRRTDALGFDPEAAPGADPDAGLWVRRALAQLDEGDREILMLREYEELSYQEIADFRRLPLNEERGASVNLGPVPVPARLRHAIADGFEAALSSLLEAALFLLRVGPGLLLWAILFGVPGWLIVRRWRYEDNSRV